MPEFSGAGYILSGIALTGLAVLGYALRTHWNITQRHDERLRLLEEERVTPEELSRIHQRIDDLGKQLSAQNSEILTTLLRLKVGA